MKLSKQVIKMKNAKKNNPKKQQLPPGMPDALVIENVIRKRYNQNWPSIIREMMARVQGVNQCWQQVMDAIMMTDGLRVTYAREGEKLVITVSTGERVEQFDVWPEELIKAREHIEVVVMDKLKHSQILRDSFNQQ